MSSATRNGKHGGRPRRQTLPADRIPSIPKPPAQPHRRPRPYAVPARGSIPLPHPALR
jgi:hypothetical protein